jgi:hypothetical protein
MSTFSVAVAVLDLENILASKLTDVKGWWSMFKFI